MKHRILQAFVCLAVLAGGLPSFAKLEVHVDEEIDFAALRTYRWVDGVPAGKEGVEKQIHKSVNEQLQALGLQLVEEGPADIDVATYVLTDTNVDLWSATATTEWGRVWSIQARAITDGTLVVRLMHGGTKDMVWHAMLETDVEPGQTAQQLERKVDRVIQKMFRKYPRPKKK